MARHETAASSCQPSLLSNDRLLCSDASCHLSSLISPRLPSSPSPSPNTSAHLSQLNSNIHHGETDCLLNLGRSDMALLRESTMYTTLSPCIMCSSTILLYGIPRVVMAENEVCLACSWRALVEGRGMTG